jgi:glycosyltransferase involved in cell wall biosynthesis
MTNVANNPQSSVLIRAAWITDFPLEWLPDLPPPLSQLPQGHPQTWQRVLLEEFEKFHDLDLHILVLRKNITKDLHFRRNNVNYHVLRVPGGVRASTFFWWDTFVVRRALKQIDPDLVHAWGTEKGAGLVAARLGYPSVLTIQGLLTWLGEKFPLNSYHKFCQALERISFRRATIVTSEPRFAIDYLHSKFPGIRILQAEHSPNRVFHAAKRENSPSKIRFLFCTGTMSRLKGIDLVCAALERLPASLNWECVLIGDIEESFREEWIHFQQRPLWKQIHWHQRLAPQEVAMQLARATIFLFPTRADTSPNSVKEAVVSGVPVVASAMGGITDYVVEGKNGYTFEAGNLDQFSKSLLAAAEHPLFKQGFVDPETLKLTRYYLSPEKMASRFLEAYQIALGRRDFPADPHLSFP